MSEADERRPVRVAVTGAAGRIGGYVARRLAEEGHELILLDVRPPTTPPPGARVVVGDLRDTATIREALAGVEAVCHLGERPGVGPGMDPAEVRAGNVAVCRSVLDAADAGGVRRIVYASSCQRYGLWGGPMNPAIPVARLPIDETQPAAPQNAYAESKAINEAQLEAHAWRSGTTAVALRLPLVLIPEDVARQERYWREADGPPMKGFGAYVDVRDVADAFARAVRVADWSEVIDGPYVAMHLFADGLAGELGLRAKLAFTDRTWPEVAADWPDHLPPATCERARRVLGWRPERRLVWRDGRVDGCR